MLGFIGNVLNPVGMLFEAGAKVLGLPPEVANAAKIAMGAMTGNVVSVIDGGVGLVGNLIDKPATTEYHRSAAQPSGYAADTPPPSTLLQSKRHLENVRDHLGKIEDMAIFLPKDGLIAMVDIQMAINHPQCPPALRESLLYLKHNPDIFSSLDTAADIGGKDGIIGAADLHSALFKLGQALDKAPPVPSTVLDPRDLEELLEKYGKPQLPVGGPSPSPGQASSGGVAENTACTSASTSGGSGSSSGSRAGSGAAGSGAAGTSASGGASRSGKLDSNFDDYVAALQTLEANYRTYDAAAGRLDTRLTRENLRAIVSNPRASEDLKAAARFFLDHDEYYSRLEMSAGVGGRDGVVGWSDVKSALQHAESDRKAYGASESTSPGAGKLSQIVNDPALGLEEKVQMILASIADGVDDEITELMGELDAAENKKTDPNDRAAAEKKQSSLQKLQFRLQQLMEKKKQMFDLMTNLSMKFNEMAKAAIQNMGRA